MRLIMMGTGPFAAPTFRALLDSPHELPALVTRPVRTRGRKKPPFSAMRELAAQHGQPIFEPEDINTPQSHDALAAWEAELYVVCDYGQILSAETLALPRLGGVNLHGSLLPRYRGAAPVNWAIYNGDSSTGVSVIHMTPQLDAGPCLVHSGTRISPRETAIELEDRLADLGVGAVLQAIDDLAAWDGVSPIGLPQDDQLASRAPRLKKSDGEIDWSRSATEIYNHVRAMQPWPGAFTFITDGDAEPLRLALLEVCVLDGVLEVEETIAARRGDARCGDARCGEVVRADEQLWMKTGDGGIQIMRLQAAGKRAMDAATFLRGRRIEVGKVFGCVSRD